MRSHVVHVIFALMAASTATRSSHYLESNDRCEPIRIQMCKDLPYNRTIFPNLMRNNNQEDAEVRLHTYLPFLKIQCSKDLQLFLCSMFAPVCTILDKPLKPCRDLCESARRGCETDMRRFTVSWPDEFDCSLFPEKDTDDICVGRNSPSATNGNPLPNDLDIQRYRTSTRQPDIPNSFDQMMDFICIAPWKAPKDLDYHLRVGNTTASDCGAPCYEMFFNKDGVEFLKLWNGIWSVVAMFPCLFAVVTYLLDRNRFPYPQMAIIHMSICYLILIALYIIGFVLGDSVACGEPFDTEEENLQTEGLIRQGTIEDWRCSVVGMALYFFRMAGALWWVMLTVAWFLNAGLKWGSEALESSYMHAIVWTVSAIQTVLVIVFKKIEGDIYSGVCYVGLWDSHTLLKFEVVPLVIYHGIGLIALIAGLVSFVRVRNEQSKAGAKTDKLESLMIRIGRWIFMLL